MKTTNNPYTLGAHTVQATEGAARNYAADPRFWDPILEAVEDALRFKGYNPNDFYYDQYNRSNDGRILTIGHKNRQKVFRQDLTLVRRMYRGPYSSLGGLLWVPRM